jgi:hypothetical protein
MDYRFDEASVTAMREYIATAHAAELRQCARSVAARPRAPAPCKPLFADGKQRFAERTS